MAVTSTVVTNMSCLGKQVGSVDDKDVVKRQRSIRTYNIKSITQIYTDWANHYLEKAKFKRFIQDLQVDVCDGVLLADVIEAVTAEKVKDINRKPKTTPQMIENIKCSLSLLTYIGVNIDGITAKDVRDGNLKTILGLFFSLSRYKQQQKSVVATKQITAPSSGSTMGRAVENSSRLPAPSNRANKIKETVSSSIPAPASSILQSNTTTKGIVKPSTHIDSNKNIQSSGIPTPGKGAANPPPSSFIPQPKSSARVDIKNSSSRIVTGLPRTTSLATPASSPSPLNSANLGKNSMLDKFKFFKDKDKEKLSNKRTSSSSGFSSARSERSDSSTSLCSDPKGGTTSSTISTSPDHHESSSSLTSSIATSNTSATSSPKLAIKALAKKTFRKNGLDSKSKSGNVESKRLIPQHKETKVKSESLIQKPLASKVDGRSTIPKPKTGSETSLTNISSIPKSESDNKLLSSKLKGQTSTKAAKDAVKPIEPDNPIKHSKISSLGPKIRTSSSSNSVKSSASKDNLLSAGTESSMMQCSQGSQILTSGGGSAIPKPTAAVKGTTKVQKDDNLIKPTQVTPPTSKPIQPAQIIEGTNQSSGIDIIPNRDVETKNRTQISGGSNRSGTLPKAMVSPMMSTKTMKSESTSVNDTTNMTKNKIETTFDKTDNVITREVCPRKNIKEGEEDDLAVNIKPMNPISRSSHYGYISGQIGGLSNSSRNLAPSIHIPTYRMQQQTDNNIYGSTNGPLKLQPMIKRGLIDNKSVDDYSDTDSIDMSAGYMSDGDMLRANNSCFTAADITSGYMSEGGASLYARTNHFNSGSRLKEFSNGYCVGPSIANDDSFDDSSSLSSGISDTIAELGTDDASGDRGLYGNIRRQNLKDGKIHAIHSKRGSSSAQGDVQVTKPSSSQKQKSDSSMQTDSSAFRQLAYKKLESKVLDGKVELRRGKSDLTSAALRSQKDRSCNVDKTPSSPKSKRKGKNDEGTSSSSASKYKGDEPEKRHRSSEMSKKSSRGTGTSNGNGQTKRLTPGTSGSSSSSRSKQKQDGDYGTTLTAQVAGVQRTDKPPALDKKGKVKVSGSTQTSSHDLHATSQVYSDGEFSLGRKHKHYGMINSSGIHSSSPTPSVASYMSGSEYQRGQRLSISSEHSSPYSVPYNGTTNNPGQSHYAWLRGREAAANISNTSTLNRGHYDHIGSSLTEADSMESLSNVSNTLHAQLQHARANSLTHARLLLHQRELAASVTPGGSPKLTRSNSIRSTKSEKMYPSMLTRSEDVDNLLLSSAASVSGATNHHGNNNSQPTSPSSQPYGLLFPDVLYLHGTGRFTFPLSPNNAAAVHRSSSASPYMSGVLSKVHSKDDELHGSALSLASTASSIYTTPEEKHSHEIRKLRRELEQAHDKVHTLTSHLNTNGHVVAAFEQSLSNMTSRLQHLTSTAEQKDSELTELRNTIELLRNKSTEAGLVMRNGGDSSHLVSSHASPHIARRHTFNDSDKGLMMKEGKISRQMSTDSVSSLSSACSMNSSTSKQSSDMSIRDKKKKKGWLRSSFSKAFSRSKKNRNGSVSDVEDVSVFQSDTSAPNSPLMMPTHAANVSQLLNNIKNSQSSSAIYEKEDDLTPEAISDLKKQLREKDMVLTDIRLEALTSAHQLESMKETVNKMRSQMINLKQDNQRLQRMVTSKSLASSQNSLQASTNRNSTESIDKKLSTSEHSGPSSIDMLLAETQVDRDGKRVIISVYLGSHGDIIKYSGNHGRAEVNIGSVFVSSKTKWDLLDNIVRRAFKEYVLRVDPVSNLGLNAESVHSYHIGDICRTKDNEVAELLPCGYLVGNNTQIKILLKGTSQASVDALSFDSLIPKSIIQRYISLLTEHRRIILCGPSGTGKTFLAQKLAEFLVLRSGKELSEGSVATFSVDHKSAKELRQYLSNVAEQCENNAADLPSVIILDNLHHVGSLADVFNGFLNTKYLKCPYIIGTMNQATCSTTNLQLHHNFRWVLCANHMEPVKGFLGRYLRKKLVEHEAKVGSRNTELNKIIDWMPRVWQHLNKFLETHSSSDVTIGPRLFLSCPVDINGSQVWFTDLWNYSIVPYLLEAVREGLQLYGRRAAWEDPAEWVLQSYPWPNTPEENSDWPPQLLKLRPEDVGYDGINVQNGPGATSTRNGVSKNTSSGNQSETDGDPLLNMLMRLQEAASYTSPHSSLNPSLDKELSTQQNRINGGGIESTL